MSGRVISRILVHLSRLADIKRHRKRVVILLAARCSARDALVHSLEARRSPLRAFSLRNASYDSILTAGCCAANVVRCAGARLPRCNKPSADVARMPAEERTKLDNKG
jgi:hypothetical protein